MPFNSILEYVEGPGGLGWTLYPVQRFILKLYYGLELDDTQRTIIIPDMFQEHTRYTLTEQEYLSYLFGEGRCSVPDTSTIPRNNLVLAMGRRTGKTTLASFIASYTIIQLLQLMNPHEIFESMTPRQRLYVVGISPNSDLRSNLLYDVQDCVYRCQDLQSAAVSYGIQGNVTFLTYAGRQLGLTNGNLVFSSLTARPRHSSGRRAMLIIDELAHMEHEQGMYDANLPTIISPGHYVLMSTPNRASGAFYMAFIHAMQSAGHVDSPLALQIPTWEVQQALGSGYLRDNYNREPSRFLVEFGAVWRDTRRVVTINVTI